MGSLKLLGLIGAKKELKFGFWGSKSEIICFIAITSTLVCTKAWALQGRLLRRIEAKGGSN